MTRQDKMRMFTYMCGVTDKCTIIICGVFTYNAAPWSLIKTIIVSRM